MSFKSEAEINYPVEEIFKVFIKSAKKDFQKFDEKNPLGATVKKRTGAYSNKQIEIIVEVTGYKENELYEITSCRDKLLFVSTYRFKKLDDEKTLFSLEESDGTKGIFAGVNAFLQKILFKKRIRTRFNYLVEGIEGEVARLRENNIRSTKKNDDEIKED